MIEFTLIIILGIAVGILVGLFPALPVYTGPFLLYYFAHSWPLEYQLTFWLVVVSGSQFFGSVATITTRIPGEESSLVYLNDLKSINHDQKNILLYNTAIGSLIAGLLSVLLVGVILHTVNNLEVTIFSSLKFQLFCYTLAIASFFFINRSVVVTLFLVALGLLLAPKNNYALPENWFWLQQWTQGYTFYMLILGLMVIPELLTSTDGNFKQEKNLFEPSPWKKYYTEKII
jgi:TctA family transporter